MLVLSPHVLPSAVQAGSTCWPKTKKACDTWRRETESVYDSVQHAVGIHQMSSGSMANSMRSRTSWAMLHRLPDTAKKTNRGGLRPQTMHASARDVSASRELQLQHVLRQSYSADASHRISRPSSTEQTAAQGDVCVCEDKIETNRDLPV